jgi:hypothetical protein
VKAARAGYTWEFKARFRRHAFGWRSQPAAQRVKQAVSEIKAVARRDRVLAADGAVAFLERVSPALENVDSSSGAIGTAVNNAIAELLRIIAEAPADPGTRDSWLERLWAAYEADRMPYIESVGERWGELCASPGVASEWADRLIDTTRLALRSDRRPGEFFHGTSACLSALYRAGRHQEIIDLLQGDEIWPYRRWAVRALAATGPGSEAIRYAESCRGPWTSDADVDRMCEEILLTEGLADEAYQRYGQRASRGGTYLATFRDVARKYPHKTAGEILRDLVATTPGEEGKWFAAARAAGLYHEALDLAGSAPCDPATLTRAARDLADERPEFAMAAGLLALRWLVQGYGYDVTGADVRAAYSIAVDAAARTGNVAEVREQARQLVSTEAPGGFVTRVLGPELGL